MAKENMAGSENIRRHGENHVKEIIVMAKAKLALGLAKQTQSKKSICGGVKESEKRRSAKKAGSYQLESESRHHPYCRNENSAKVMKIIENEEMVIINLFINGERNSKMAYVENRKW